jgi:hypothetical protein
MVWLLLLLRTCLRPVRGRDRAAGAFAAAAARMVASELVAAAGLSAPMVPGENETR